MRAHIIPGLVIGDTYSLTQQIGQGSMGAVFIAEHLRLPNLKVAVKFLLADVEMNALTRFQQEAHVMATLAHPNIVRIIDLNVLPEGEPYIVMEYLKGESLGERLKRGTYQVDECIQVLAQVASALQSTHQKGIIHRDLKPDNIFLCQPNELVEYQQVKVLDFGVSKVLDNPTNATHQGFVGTPCYMSPEQAQGAQNIDLRSDLFALGIIAYQMLSGYLPFNGEQVIQVLQEIINTEPIPLSQLSPNHPNYVYTAIHKALNKDPNERYHNCAEFIQALSAQSEDHFNLDSFTEVITQSHTFNRPSLDQSGVDQTAKISNTEIQMFQKELESNIEFNETIQTKKPIEFDKTTSSPLPSMDLDHHTPSTLADFSNTQISETPIPFLGESGFSSNPPSIHFNSSPEEPQNITRQPPWKWITSILVIILIAVIWRVRIDRGVERLKQNVSQGVTQINQTVTGLVTETRYDELIARKRIEYKYKLKRYQLGKASYIYKKGSRFKITLKLKSNVTPNGPLQYKIKKPSSRTSKMELFKTNKRSRRFRYSEGIKLDKVGTWYITLTENNLKFAEITLKVTDR